MTKAEMLESKLGEERAGGESLFWQRSNSSGGGRGSRGMFEDVVEREQALVVGIDGLGPVAAELVAPAE
jgi:hypothetical protein